MNDQLTLEFPYDEYADLKNIVRVCYTVVKKKYPQPVSGESVEEYNEFLRDEVLLEISDRLKEIALRKQNKRIEFFYKIPKKIC